MFFALALVFLLLVGLVVFAGSLFWLPGLAVSVLALMAAVVIAFWDDTRRDQLRPLPPLGGKN